MKKKQKILVLNQRAALDRNKNINFNTVAAHERLEQELRKLGVVIKPSFNLEPPLGRDRTGIQSWNR